MRELLACNHARGGGGGCAEVWEISHPLHQQGNSRDKMIYFPCPSRVIGFFCLRKGCYQLDQYLQLIVIVLWSKWLSMPSLLARWLRLSQNQAHRRGICGWTRCFLVRYQQAVYLHLLAGLLLVLLPCPGFKTMPRVWYELSALWCFLTVCVWSS